MAGSYWLQLGPLQLDLSRLGPSLLGPLQLDPLQLGLSLLGPWRLDRCSFDFDHFSLDYDHCSPGLDCWLLGLDCWLLDRGFDYCSQLSARHRIKVVMVSDHS